MQKEESRAYISSKDLLPSNKILGRKVVGHVSLVMAQPCALATVCWHRVVPRGWPRGHQCGDGDLIQVSAQPGAVLAPEHSEGQELDPVQLCTSEGLCHQKKMETVKDCCPNPHRNLVKVPTCKSKMQASTLPMTDATR